MIETNKKEKEKIKRYDRKKKKINLFDFLS
jgi:hypothetical protein